MNNTVAAVASFRFLGTTISQDMKWDTHIDFIVKKAQQKLYFHQLKMFNLPQAHITQFYSAVIQSVLCSSITVWFGSASKADIRRLQWTVRQQKGSIIGVLLPRLQDLYKSLVKKRACNIITDPSHPGHNLFALLPSGRCYRSNNSFSIFNYCLSLKYFVNTYAYFFLYSCI